jgi:hypothetical protein
MDRCLFRLNISVCAAEDDQVKMLGQIRSRPRLKNGPKNVYRVSFWDAQSLVPTVRNFG